MTTYQGYEPFPSADAVADKEYHLHSVTGDEYIFNEGKSSWRVMSAVKNRVFHSPIAPDIPTNGQQLDGYLPRQGDMWWDTNLMELRVWHEPIPDDPTEKTPPGRWISSTNPHMSPLSPKKNRVIGKLSLLDENDNPFRYQTVYEDTLYRLKVERTDSTAEESLIEYSWTATPPEINGVRVNFSHPNASATSVVIPALSRIDGVVAQQSISLACTVSAIDKIETFIEPSKQVRSGTLPIREIPVSSQVETGSVDVTILSDKDLELSENTEGKYLVYVINSSALAFDDNYNNADDWPPGRETYLIQKANISLTQQTTVMDFIYASESVREDYYLAFYEDPNRTVPWGSTGVGADLGIQDPAVRNHRLIVDEDFYGNIYFTKYPAGSENTMAGHIEWGQLPDPEGDIGIVTITGTGDPGKNVESTYNIAHSGDVPENKTVKTLTTSDPLAVVNGNKITFGTTGYQSVNAIVKSIYATDSPQTASIGVDVEPGLSKIGNFTISGDNKAVVGTPYVYTYSYDGDVVDHTVEFTTTDSDASITNGSIIFGQPGDFTVTGTITADDSVEGELTDSIDVNVLSGIPSSIMMNKPVVEAATGVPETYIMTIDEFLGDPTHTWSTTRSTGGTVIRSNPEGVITYGTSGREFSEEIVDGDVSGDSFILLDRATAIDEGLFITFPTTETRTSIGLYLSTMLDGAPDDSESVAVTMSALTEDGGVGASASVSVQSLTPNLYTIQLPYVDQKILGIRLISKVNGSRIAVHGYTVDGFLVESYLNDIIVLEYTAGIASIAMFKFDEDRIVQCIADGDQGRSVARLAVPVIDPPEPSIGQTLFQSPNRFPASGETVYTYQVETTGNTVPVSYSAVFNTIATNIPLDLGYEFDDSEVESGILKIKFPYFFADDVDHINEINLSASLSVIISDARDNIDSSEILPSGTSSISKIEVQYPFQMIASTSVDPNVDLTAGANFYVGWTEVVSSELDSETLVITPTTMTATDENGNAFPAASMTIEGTDRRFAFDGLAAGTYVFASDVNYADGDGKAGDVIFRFTKTVS